MGLWSNLLSRFKTQDESASGRGTYIDIPPEPAPSVETGQEKSNWLARLNPATRREAQLATLQAGYSEMVGMVRSIRDHLDRQADTQQKLINVLERLPESMEGLKSVNKAAEQQVEVLHLLRQQMAANVNHDQQLVDSMNRFNSTLGVMDETSRSASKTVADLMEKSRETEQTLLRVVERSEQRIRLVILSFILLAVLALAYLVYYGPDGLWTARPVIAAPPVQAPAQPAPIPTEPQSDNLEP